MNDLSPSPARDLLRRWDAQQTAYIKHRDQRFAVMAETISRLCGDSPRVLDLACGPGSTSAAILALLPKSRIVAVDKDPVLLAIAEDVFRGNADIQVLDRDLDRVEWLAEFDGTFDAVVSSTALHWLRPDALSRLYFGLAGKVREGGVFLNADHLLFDDIAQPTLKKLAAQDDAINQQIAFEAGTDTWDAWWEAVRSYPQYSDAVARRELIWKDVTPPQKVTLGYHLQALRSAGFMEVGTVWQYLDDYVICAVR